MKNEDLTGKIIGNIEVLSLVGSDKNKRKMYKIRCVKCGKEDIRDSTSIRKYGSFKCYCKDIEIQDHIKSMIGKQFGDFKIEYLKERKNNINYFHLKCVDCGYEEDVNELHLTENRKCPNHNKSVKLTGRFNVSNMILKEERDKILEDRYKGKTIGSLKIESLKENNGNGKVVFYCTCIDCGAEHIPVRLDGIKKYGKTSKCYCSNYDEDLTGKRFTNLDVLYLTRKENGKKYYNCRCIKCGDIVECRSDDIKKYGKSSKCSCIKTKRKYIPENERIKDDLTGRIFGDLTVIEFSHIDPMTNRSMYKCRCQKGHTDIVSRDNLLSGNSTRCRRCGYDARANSNTIDLSGKKFGYIEVLEKDEENTNDKLHGEVYWKCKCHYVGDNGVECGNIISKPGYLIRKGSITSCGCHPELHPSYKHGFKSYNGDINTKFYSEWASIKYRCNNIDKYIERGMTDRWNLFENFRDDMYDSYIEAINTYGVENLSNISIDRINNDGPYCKENTEWVDPLIQENNKIANYEYFGSMYTLANLYRNFADPGLSFLEFRNNISQGNSITVSLRYNRDSVETPVRFISKTGDIIPDPITGRID